ncbi:hypothetical protein BDV10DRAFT_189447 [Aspergillus recurvatus]
MSIYKEEFETATPLIVSLLWALPGERPTHIIDQLRALNTQIRSKNLQAKRKSSESLINVEFFISLSEKIQAAAADFTGLNDVSKFRKCQETLRNKIDDCGWPEDWNIDLDQFEDFCEELESPDDVAEEEASSIASGDRSSVSDDYREDTQEWEDVTGIDDAQSDAERTFGIPFTRGPILGWAGNKYDGYSLIIGHQHQGKRTARVIQSKTLPDKIGDDLDIELSDRGQQPFDDDTDYDAQLVKGFGLVAWKVAENYELDPVLSLHPGRLALDTELYLRVLWADGVWTWESRQNLQHIMHELTEIQLDLLIYRLATVQDADYVEALTGQRPTYPEISSTDLQRPRGRSSEAKKHEGKKPSLLDNDLSSGRQYPHRGQPARQYATRGQVDPPIVHQDQGKTMRRTKREDSWN